MQVSRLCYNGRGGGENGPIRQCGLNADGERCSVDQIVRNLLKEDVTYEFIAYVAQCPLETVKCIAAKQKKQ